MSKIKYVVFSMWLLYPLATIGTPISIVPLMKWLWVGPALLLGCLWFASAMVAGLVFQVWADEDAAKKRNR